MNSVEPEAEGDAVCPNCGARLADRTHFCPNCGAAWGKAVWPPPPKGNRWVQTGSTANTLTASIAGDVWLGVGLFVLDVVIGLGFAAPGLILLLAVIEIIYVAFKPGCRYVALGIVAGFLGISLLLLLGVCIICGIWP